MTIPVDTSIWADHFRSSDPALAALLVEGGVVMHPFVIGELAMGNLRQRDRTVAALDLLPKAPLAAQREFLDFVRDHDLGGTGLGFVDASLLVAASLGGLLIWTRDRRLAERAEKLSLAWRAE